LALVTAGGLIAASVAAQERPFVDEPELEVPRTFQEAEGWLEDYTELPDYPQAENLVAFDLSTPDPSLDYRIDSSTLAIGEDGVIRYALVMEPKGGGPANVQFEGIDCATARYKTYAYGTPDAGWRRMRRSQWKPIKEDRYGRYRGDLWLLYFCDRGLGRPYPLARIVQRMKNSGQFQQKTFFEDL